MQTTFPSFVAQNTFSLRRVLITGDYEADFQSTVIFVLSLLQIFKSLIMFGIYFTSDSSTVQADGSYGAMIYSASTIFGIHAIALALLFNGYRRTAGHFIVMILTLLFVVPLYLSAGSLVGIYYSTPTIIVLALLVTPIKSALFYVGLMITAPYVSLMIEQSGWQPVIAPPDANANDHLTRPFVTGISITFMVLVFRHSFHLIKQRIYEAQKDAEYASKIANAQAEETLRAMQLQSQIQKVSKTSGWIADLKDNTFYQSNSEGAAAYSHTMPLDEVRDADIKAQISKAREGKQSWHEDIERTEDGELRWEHQIGKLEIEKGEVVKIIAVAQDISEKKAAETQLLSAQKMEAIGTLAAGIAHEINTPTQYVSDNTHFVGESVNDVITFIKEMKTILQSDDQSVDELKEQLKAALDDLDFEFIQDEVPAAIKQTKEGISRISKIVSAMKDFSHPGATDISHADINRAIEATLLVSTNRWKFVADVETTFGDIPAVPCYIDEINQVILNLIVNAADAIAEKHAGTDEKGSIEITTRQAGNNVLISISDSGAGMPPEVKSRIFDPFFTTKEVGKGTGQGLSIGYDIIVNKHNGTLTCDSEAGAGTTFTLSLPLTTTN